MVTLQARNVVKEKLNIAIFQSEKILFKMFNIKIDTGSNQPLQSFVFVIFTMALTEDLRPDVWICFKQNIFRIIGISEYKIIQLAIHVHLYYWHKPIHATSHSMFFKFSFVIFTIILFTLTAKYLCFPKHICKRIV